MGKVHTRPTSASVFFLNYFSKTRVFCLLLVSVCVFREEKRAPLSQNLLNYHNFPFFIVGNLQEERERNEKSHE